MENIFLPNILMLCGWEKVEVCLEGKKKVQGFWGENSYCLLGMMTLFVELLHIFSFF